MAKQYKRILWNSVPSATQTKLANMMQIDLVEAGHRSVKCVVCDTFIFKKVTNRTCYGWLTVTEQRHFDSERHQQNVVLWKLAGNEG